MRTAWPSVSNAVYLIFYNFSVQRDIFRLSLPVGNPLHRLFRRMPLTAGAQDRDGEHHVFLVEIIVLCGGRGRRGRVRRRPQMSTVRRRTCRHRRGRLRIGRRRQLIIMISVMAMLLLLLLTTANLILSLRQHNLGPVHVVAREPVRIGDDLLRAADGARESSGARARETRDHAAGAI
jgi:hypothetical protein